jgi:hypothetical protein
MAIEDLDLEFEDDEEVSGTEALDVDVDLSFSANEEEEAAAQGRPTPRKRPKPRTENSEEDSPIAEENISDIGQARARSRVNPRPAKPNVDNRANGSNTGGGSGDINDLRHEIAILKQQMQAIEHQADVRVAVAEAEKDYLIEYVSNAKVLDHQVTQVLGRINKKVPQLATEVKMIKKYMNEFLSKSGPKKKKKDAA